MITFGMGLQLPHLESTPELRTAKLGFKNYKHYSITWYTTYLDILNRLGVDHQCDNISINSITDDNIETNKTTQYTQELSALRASYSTRSLFVRRLITNRWSKLHCHC